MLSKNQIKDISSLRMVKYRRETRRFIAEGNKLVTDLLGSRIRVKTVYGVSSWIDSVAGRFDGYGVPVVEVTPSEMERISQLSSPGPVLAVAEIPPTAGIPPPEAFGKFILALDDIRDPGNMGTIIRIADWFGIGAVVCSETCVDLFNPKVVQATMGSIARVPLFETNLIDLFTFNITNRQVPVYGAFLDGTAVYSCDPAPPGIILIGNESRGIAENLDPFVTRRIFIPPFGDSGEKAESLNASIAAAVICSEFQRKHLMK